MIQFPKKSLNLQKEIFMFQVEEENSQNEETKQKPSLVFGFRNTLDYGKKEWEYKNPA